MKNFWLERSEKSVEQTIEKILNDYTLSYNVTMDACSPCNTIIIDTGISQLSISYTPVIEKVIASIDSNGIPRDASNSMITMIAFNPQTTSVKVGDIVLQPFTGYTFKDATFQKEVERIEAEGWVLDV